MLLAERPSPTMTNCKKREKKAKKKKNKVTKEYIFEGGKEKKKTIVDNKAGPSFTQSIGDELLWLRYDDCYMQRDQ